MRFAVSLDILRCLLFLVFAGALVGCSVSGDGADEGAAKDGWHNKPLVKYIFGDFEEAEVLEFSDSSQVTALEKRGAYVARVAACGVCHGNERGEPNSPLVGGRLLNDGFGEVYAPNITPDPNTGIGAWNVAELMRAIRASIDREGRPLSVDLHSSYRWMSDRDAQSVALYLLSLSPVENSVERRHLGPFARNKWGIIRQHKEVQGYVPELANQDGYHYGRYISHHVAQCATCHTKQGGLFEGEQPFAGNTEQQSGVIIVKQLRELLFAPDVTKDPESASLLSEEARGEIVGDVDKEAFAETEQEDDGAGFPVLGPDIRGNSETGLSAWGSEDIVRYLSSGKSPAGSLSNGELCPWPYFSAMTETDKRAIARYLKRL